MANLVTNARDAMPLGGKAVITTSNLVIGTEDPIYPSVKPGAYVRLSVAGNGVEMTDEVRLHIFEPFFTTKNVGQGTGLGLATVYGIVTQSGGYVSARSGPNQGTILDILLPASIIVSGQ